MPVDAAERQVALKRLLGVAVVFTVAFVISGWLPSPESEAGDEAVIIPLRETSTPSATEVRGGEGGAPASTPAPVRGAASASASAPASPTTASAPTRPADGADVATRTPAARPSAPDGAAATTQWWVQAASYRDPRIAQHGEGRLEALGLPAQLQKTQVAGTELWRLRAGPFTSRGRAEAARQRLEAEGFRGARTLSIP